MIQLIQCIHTENPTNILAVVYIIITATTNNHVLVTAIEVLVRVSCYDWIMLEKLNSQKRAQRVKNYGQRNDLLKETYA